MAGVAVAVHAVDSSPHLAVELAQVRGNRGDMVEAVRRIPSAGGGMLTRIDVSLIPRRQTV